MHVDVIQLRNRGVKLPPSELDGPTRGHLRMVRWHLCNKTEDRMTVTATLTAFGERNNPPLLPHLKEAIVIQMDHRGMVIVGLQAVGGQDYKQAWAVIPVQACAAQVEVAGSSLTARRGSQVTPATGPLE